MIRAAGREVLRSDGFVRQGSISPGCGGFGLRGHASALAGLGGLHLQCVVEPVEVVEETDSAKKLDDFALRIETEKFGKLLVRDVVRIAGDGLGEVKGGFFGGSEIGAIGPFGEM